jgi:HSP20 family protein
MFPITRTRGPLPELQGLNRIIDEAFRGWPFQAAEAPLVGTWIPPVDIMENPNQVRIMAELPGVKPEDVKISMEDGVLTVRGEKQQLAEEKTERVHRYERTYGVFERSFSVPTSVDSERISASYDSGVLTITLPKVEKARPRQITVEVSKK